MTIARDIVPAMNLVRLMALSCAADVEFVQLRS